ncbi:hypothetical protein [Carnimonas bestiolae]
MFHFADWPHGLRRAFLPIVTVIVLSITSFSFVSLCVNRANMLHWPLHCVLLVLLPSLGGGLVSAVVEVRTGSHG